jgi:tetratricopeptide (TPR) repeat protein
VSRYLALALLLLANRASAEPLGYWQRVLHPQCVRAARLVREGRAQLAPTLALGSGPALPLEFATQRTLSIEGARLRFSLALQLDPGSLEARLAHAETLTMAEGFAQPEARRAAIEELEALRALAPLYEAEQVAFQLGLLHARAGEPALARREYEASLAMHSADAKQPAQLLDLAEVTMFDGDLPRALALYERAARESEPSSRVLALWGSALVLDRLGEHGAALEAARRAIAGERAPFAALHRAGVFFVPAHELEYYEALGSLALADAERRPGEPWAAVVAKARRWLAHANDPGLVALARALQDPALASHQPSLPRVPPGRRAPPADQPALPSASEGRALLWLLRALAGFERYLVQDGGDGPFAEDAREHVDTLAGALRP